MLARQLEAVLLQDLKKKMVLLAGPRQCGKTTLAKDVAKRSGLSFSYYNWDTDSHRKQLVVGQLNADTRLWILDELHKYRRWKNWLKGMYDEYRDRHSFLVTGSAKLDAYSRGGDSLQGRYFFHRLHPHSPRQPVFGCFVIPAYPALGFPVKLPVTIKPNARYEKVEKSVDY